VSAGDTTRMPLPPCRRCGAATRLDTRTTYTDVDDARQTLTYRCVESGQTVSVEVGEVHDCGARRYWQWECPACGGQHAEWVE
jgi:hypothetical protein